MALNLFGAVSVILNGSQLNPDDKRYLIEQLVKYHVYYYRYFENIHESGCPSNILNQLALKAKTAKSNIVGFYNIHHEIPQVAISKLFPNDDN
ncbi:MAG: hypothetical protein MJZ48_00130 [Paludibacteraceae bacterium]|nr:hypothetical protein [Paludibacteraceae bacterium]